MNLANRILVVGPSWVGDMVMAQSLFKVLHLENPDYEIDVLAPSWSLPLIERMPEVSKAINLPFQHGQFKFMKRWFFGLSLKNQYQQVIILTNSWKSAISPFSAGITKRTGWVGEYRFGLINDIRFLDKKRYKKTVERFVALALPANTELSHIPFPSLDVKSIERDSTIFHFDVENKKNKLILGICPGSEVVAKCWTRDGYAQLANRYLEKNWDIWLFGSERDKDCCDEINQWTNNRCKNFSGKTNLLQVIDLMSICDAVVSNDSGLMHVAAAVNRPLVGIFLCTDPQSTPPLCINNEIISRYEKDKN